MKYVEIYKLKNDGSQEVLITCDLKKTRIVCKGDKNLVKSLEKDGIMNYSNPREKIFPKDGLKFLEQLKFNFKSGYLNASDVMEK
jgi:hypothetical protein